MSQPNICNLCIYIYVYLYNMPVCEYVYVTEVLWNNIQTMGHVPCSFLFGCILFFKVLIMTQFPHWLYRSLSFENHCSRTIWSAPIL